MVAQTFFCQHRAPLDHFPMSENPEAFIGHLLPVLDKIRNSTAPR
jgi:hypothetical protein